MKIIIRIVIAILVIFIFFYFIDDIKSFVSNITGNDTESSTDWSGLRKQAFESYQYDDPEIAIDHLTEYEQAVQAELKKVSKQADNSSDSSHSAIIIKLYCELGVIHKKLAEKYLLLGDETLYYDHINKSKEYFENCSVDLPALDDE